MTESVATETLAVRRRRECRREEETEQRKLAELLGTHVDPARVWWSSLENRPRTMLSGLLAKLRGCRCGIPDVLLIFRRTASPRCPTHICFLELKSKRGRLSPAQKVVRSELLAVGATWFLARSANAALTALYCSGVPFRRPWKPSRPLARWEGPFAHVTRLPQHPVVAAERREEKQRYRLRKEIREKEAARLAAARDGAGLIDARAHRRVG